MAGQGVGRLLADGAQLRVVQRAGIGTRGEQHLEEDVDRVRRSEDHERGGAEVLDGIAHAVIGGQAPDLDRGDLDHGRPEIDELAAKRVDLVARACDQDAAAVQRAPGKRVQPLRHLHARSEDKQRVAAQPVGRSFASQLAERGRNPVLARLAGIEDQGGRCLRRAAVLQQRRDA